MKEPIMKKTGLFDGGGSEDNEEDEEQTSNCGNAFLHLPYGLAKERGLSTEGMRPREVWDMLKGEGVNKEAEDKKLEKKLDESQNCKEVEQKPTSKIANKKYNSAKEAYKKITLTGIEKSFSMEIENRLLDLANTYGVDFKSLNIKTTSSRKVFGHYKSGFAENKNGEIHFNKILGFSNVSMKDKETALQGHQLEARIRGSKNITALSTVDHEIAHAIDLEYSIKSNSEIQKGMLKYNSFKLSSDFLERNNQVKEINNLSRKLFSSQYNLSSKVKMQLMNEYKLDENGFNDLVKQEFGSYANTNTHEFFAEGFSAYRNIPKEQQSDFVKKFGEYSEKNMKEVFNNGSNRQ